ncbi:hypothetical protein [Sphingomonas sp. 28-63-12]|uniref:hypothetical protein n=1 Tax=Sphingomonas sp. 28-63-12 TaxID=1970434 RepID=UPI0035A85FB5
MAYGVNVLNEAMSQRDRVLSAPAPNTVQVDGRTSAQLLSFAAHYGALIKFYDLENQENGNWVSFFASDPVIAHALHAALDLPEIERSLNRLLAEVRAARDHRGRAPPLRRVLSVIARLLGILDRAHIGPSDHDTLMQHFTRTDRRDGIAEPLRRLHRHLEGQGQSVDTAMRGMPLGQRSAWLDTLADILDDFISTLLVELEAGVTAAKAAMQEAMDLDTHAPHTAIYTAFIALFLQARTVLNSFPRRLVDFYYGDILKQHSLAAEPSRTFLTFTRAQAATQASIPRDAQFLAGSDSQGQAINFAAVNALEVTAASVEGLSVHYIPQVPLTPGASHLVSGPMMSGLIAVDPGTSETAESFPLFGTSKSGVFGALTMKQAALGFCVASPILLLAGGTRTVNIALTVSRKDRGDAGARVIEVLVQSLDWLTQLVKASLELHYSTGGGWIKVEPFDVTSAVTTDDGATAVFTISFTLPADAPPLEPLAATPNADAPPPSQPANAFPDQPAQPAVIASMKLGDDHQPAAFGMLSAVTFDAINLAVQVVGLDRLTITTPTGAVSGDQNFPLFGLPPVQFAGFEIQAPELFAKPIDSLTLSIPWAGLPVTSTGFQGYYQNYQIDADGVISPTPLFDNRSFQIRYGLINPGYWTLDDSQTACLFQTAPASDDSGATTDAAVPVERVSVLPVPGLSTQSAPPYFTPASSALSVTLATPDYAFGNVLYASNMMAASQAQAAAAHGRQDGAHFGSAVQIAKLATVNATTPDRGYWGKVRTAVHNAVSSLTGEALAAVQQAIGQSRAPAQAQMAWLQDLKATLAAAAAGRGSIIDWLMGRGGVLAEAVAVLESLGAWVSAHEDSLGSHAAPLVSRAKLLMTAAGNVTAAHAAAKDQPVAMARPNIAAASQQLQASLQPPGLPNAPWLPMASGLTIDYLASAGTTIKPDSDPKAARLTSLATIAPASAPRAGLSSPLEIDFWHVGPFGKFKAPTASADDTVSMMPQVTANSALYIQLSTPVSQVALLFVLSASEDGWWDVAPAIAWEEYIGGVWQPIIPIDDTTTGMQNSGIVTLPLTVPPGATKAPRIRVSAIGDTSCAPIVQAVIANAVATRWIGPGGADTLGTPLPAGTITKSAASLAGIGSITQPMASFGGRPPATGEAFQRWMAERLRHKGFAIDCWDYARLALEAAPSIWQAAIIPATDQQTQTSAPGQAWLVIVAGPGTPNVTDWTVPQVDIATLADIGDTLNACSSPFARLAITNPPYLRLKVSATIEFIDSDTGAFWADRLSSDLVSWLSPLPPSDLGTRPANYYTPRAVAEFVRHRPYVRGITHFLIVPQEEPATGHYYYLTSAPSHDIVPLSPHGNGHGHEAMAATAAARP